MGSADAFRLVSRGLLRKKAGLPCGDVLRLSRLWVFHWLNGRMTRSSQPPCPYGVKPEKPVNDCSLQQAVYPWTVVRNRASHRNGCPILTSRSTTRRRTGCAHPALCAHLTTPFALRLLCIKQWTSCHLPAGYSYSRLGFRDIFLEFALPNRSRYSVVKR